MYCDNEEYAPNTKQESEMVLFCVSVEVSVFTIPE